MKNVNIPARNSIFGDAWSRRKLTAESVVRCGKLFFNKETGSLEKVKEIFIRPKKVKATITIVTDKSKVQMDVDFCFIKINLEGVLHVSLNDKPVHLYENVDEFILDLRSFKDKQMRLYKDYISKSENKMKEHDLLSGIEEEVINDFAEELL